MSVIAPAITVTGTLNDIFGNADQGAKLSFQLCNYGPFLPRIANSNMFAKVRPASVLTDATGAFSQKLYGNDVIIPASTYYTLTLEDENNTRVQTQAYLFTGTGNVDISGIPPYQPVTPPNFPIQYQYADLFLVGNPASPNVAPPGTTFTLSRTYAPGTIIQLYYNGLLNLQNIHYTCVGRQITLNWQALSGDNIYVVYTATTAN